MHGVTVPFFELWVVAALLRGLRTRRLRAFGWAGLALGLGLCFYSPLRVFPVVVAGFSDRVGLRWLVQIRRAHPEWTAGAPGAADLGGLGVPLLLMVLGVVLPSRRWPSMPGASRTCSGIARKGSPLWPAPRPRRARCGRCSTTRPSIC